MEFRKAQFTKRSYRNQRNGGNQKGELSSRNGDSRYNRDSRSEGSRFSRNDRGSRFNRGSEDNQRGEIYKATCGDCGNKCDLPFKPKYDRPVYCRECFQNHKPQKRNVSEFPRYDRDRSPIHSRDNFRKYEYQTNTGYKKNTTDYNSNLSTQLFGMLGKKKCVICGFDDERALGFGKIDDKESFNFVQRGNIPSSWEKYISEPELAKKQFQILCLNCNQIKQKEFND